ncbi:Mitochondrial inner membrane translocase subunit Tim17/Tim22/Tim23/peroxisomal protein [Canna indica]|uniref:Mitochondrial inner membrane translocase subunit Tim17/Tim22/Tim23/peroxisomal protein n=1 Tax=Canna indica TaxID=4628 RepID=A0AAQ3K0S2_9LILI|nr:Mitochondrial inner membrane translocase subunit Tim17/Tim22/Tim23/peroxisomal protein [Canna indica]
MDLTDKQYLEDEDSPLMKTIKGATTGLAAGTIWGTIVATWHDVPRVERNVALPGLINLKLNFEGSQRTRDQRGVAEAKGFDWVLGLHKYMEMDDLRPEKYFTSKSKPRANFRHDRL